MSVTMCPRREAGDFAMCEAMADCRTQNRRYVNTLVDALHDASVRREELEHALAAERGRAAALEWLRREAVLAWDDTDSKDLCRAFHFVATDVEGVTECEYKKRCERAEQERDEARRFLAIQVHMTTEDCREPRDAARDLWGADVAAKLFPEGK